MRVGTSSGFHKRGFSLLEILGVIAVIVVIMTMLAMGVRGLLPLSKSKQAHTDIIQIQPALEAYKSAFEEYPKEVMAGGSSPTMEEILFNALTGRMASNGTLGNFPPLLDRSVLEFSTNAFFYPWVCSDKARSIEKRRSCLRPAPSVMTILRTSNFMMLRMC